ncbi:MAG: Trk system potassium transporter TrkA [Sporomusaceae bacterium]|nr:Trk system potassium transporter TrkA [Sporomusaceae bacterium]
MKIVIVGAGKVGYSLAQRLTEEDHEVVVIEQDEERREIIQSSLDIMTHSGNGASPKVLTRAGVNDAEMLIAVTDSDEVNLVACVAAKQAGVSRTIARVRNEEYAEQDQALFEQMLGVDMLINPEMVTALEISHILRTPEALDVENFAGGRVKLLEVKIRSNSPYCSIPLKDLTLPKEILIAGIMRVNHMIIPHGDDMLLPHDCVFFVGEYEAISQFAKKFVVERSKVERVLIIGAGRIGKYLALLLEKSGMKVKMIEKEKARCQKAAAVLQDSMVLCADGSDMDVLKEEGVSEADAVICLTDDDKLNLLLALLTKHLGAKRTIVRLSRSEYIPLIEQVGVDVAISPRLLTTGVILRLVRRGDIVHVSLLEGAKAEASEFVVSEHSPLVGKELRHAQFPARALIGAVVRGREIIVPNGTTRLLPGDRAITFILPDAVNQVMSFFKGRT